MQGCPLRCPLSGGGFNGSTQHPFILSWHVGTVCIQRACKDVVHAKAEAALRKRWKSGQCGQTSPECSRKQRRCLRYWRSMGELFQRHATESPAEYVASTD